MRNGQCLLCRRVKDRASLHSFYAGSFNIRVRPGSLPLALDYRKAETIGLGMDNVNIHRRKSLTDLYAAEMAGEIWDRSTVHYTPAHGRWLNQAEIESASLDNVSAPDESPNSQYCAGERARGICE